MTRVMSVKEYRQATVWQRAEQMELLNHATNEAFKRRKARKAELRVLDAEFELAHERLLLVEEKRALVGKALPTAADYSRRWAIHRFNDPAGVGQQRLLEATAEAWA